MNVMLSFSNTYSYRVDDFSRYFYAELYVRNPSDCIGFGLWLCANPKACAITRRRIKRTQEVDERARKFDKAEENKNEEKKA